MEENAADATFAGLSRKDILLALIVPMLLVIVATTAVLRSVTQDQSSWSGVGFGMFATVDNEDSRFLEIRQRTEDGWERIGLPHELLDEGFAAKVLPTDDRLVGLARAILRQSGSDGVTAISVTLWGIEAADATTGLAVRAHPIANGQAVAGG